MILVSSQNIVFKISMDDWYLLSSLSSIMLMAAWFCSKSTFKQNASAGFSVTYYLTLRLRCIFWKLSKFWSKISFIYQTSNSISGVSVGPNKTIILPIENTFNSLSNYGGLEANEANIQLFYAHLISFDQCVKDFTRCLISKQHSSNTNLLIHKNRSINQELFRRHIFTHVSFLFACQHIFY